MIHANSGKFELTRDFEGVANSMDEIIFLAFCYGFPEQSLTVHDDITATLCERNTGPLFFSGEKILSTKCVRYFRFLWKQAG